MTIHPVSEARPTSDAPESTQAGAMTAVSDLISKGLMVQALSVAARLRIADRLRDRPMEAAELASAAGAHAPTLYRLLRALTGLGVLTQDDQSRFALTPLGRTLCAGPGSIRERAAFIGEPWVWNAWGNLYESVMTGDSAFRRTHGMSLFAYLECHPEARSDFHRNLSAQSELQIPSILEAYDLSHFERLVDVGGGRGALLTAILAANPKPTGVLYDLPEVVAETADIASRSGVGRRFERVGGSFFDSVPPGGDCYVLKLVIHDWDDEHAVRILQNVRAAIVGGGKLLLIEFVMPSGDAFHHAKFMDLSILVLTENGRERTDAEYRELLAAGGFALTTVIQTDSALSIIESVPA
jgi:DNA-binding transcriptional ArsR family regulator